MPRTEYYTMQSHLHIIIYALGIVHVKDEHVLHSMHFTLVTVSESVATGPPLPRRSRFGLVPGQSDSAYLIYMS